jgi:NitT/TauT family transport system substrate-binding protein
MGQPKWPFYVFLVLMAGALGYYGYTRIVHAAPANNATHQVNSAGTANTTPSEDPSPANSAPPATTVKEYKFKPAERLPEVKGISRYRPLQNDTVRFAINVWAGWGPIILANDGFKPGKVWKTPDGKDFKVELVLIDNPVAMRDAYSTGEIHFGWATLDMMPLFLEGWVDKMGKPRDAGIMPRVFQQVDFSDGGDGVVVREDIKTVKDLRGRQVVLAQNSPSNFFLLDLLDSAQVQPGEVDMVFTEDAFQAAAAFNAQKGISAAVSWSPDIYNLAAAKPNRMLVTTATANKLIADVYFTSGAFAKDHPDICEGLVRGIFDGIEELKQKERQAYCANLMAEGYSIPAGDAIKMFADAHNTNWAENSQFFLNPTNPTNFESIWKRAYQLYRRVGAVTHQPVPFDQVMDFSIIQRLSKVDKYKNSTDDYKVNMKAKTAEQVHAESDEILTKAIVIHFAPNSSDLNMKITSEDSGKTTERPYDPNVTNVLKDISQLTGKYSGARVVIEGHTDSSMKGQVPAALVKDLSAQRAHAVMNALVEKYSLDPNRFAAAGYGWDKPFDPTDPNNQALNRRVEVKVFSAEKQ